ncbi:M50 family metallopeptidase [Bacillus massilinigeriensis]|uniref:M50 family metallopeptidase n=1 Tax=Bacillus mediterraneensis TaxID=1805474 RepID=UPI0008F96A0C|nr:M50 family metallopeptidase [Bacillus mediterraneensis]
MSKAIGLFKITRLHPLLFFVMFLAVVTAHFIELLLLLLIIFVHELGHAAAASHFSWRIRRITLLPFGGVAEMDEHGNRSLMEETIVVAAGPFQHLWLAGLSMLLYEVGILPEYWHTRFMDFNKMVLLFNLIPIWPLDGGKLLLLFFSLWEPFGRAHRKMLLFSTAFLALFAGLAAFMGPFTLNVWIILSFLCFSMYFEWKQRRYVFLRFLMERYYGKSGDFRHLKPLNVTEEEKLHSVLEQFQRGCKHPVIVTRKDGNKTSLDENELLHAYFAEKMLTAKIGDLLYTY